MPIYLIAAFVLYSTGAFLRKRGYREGYDAGKVSVIGQLQSELPDHSSQWVFDGNRVHFTVGGSEVGVDEKVFTNRFFTNWTLTVREP